MATRVGTSGWSYGHWVPELYPPGLAAGKWLERYVAEFTTVELNASFYRWPRPAVFAGWRERLPEGFKLSVKAPRGLTHARRLADPQAWAERIAAGLRELGDRRGVLLVQLAPAMARDDDRLAGLLAVLPDWAQTAVEFRHPSWLDEKVFGLLERAGAGYCVMSGAKLPCVLRVTAPFAYVRLHGPDHDQLYAGSYSDDDLAWWAARIGEWEQAGHDVYAYFNNDGAANAVRNARTLRDLAGGWPPPGARRAGLPPAARG
jgi:uncharacterized protein YecE (DUF72 family)